MLIGETTCGYPYMVGTFWTWGCRARFVGTSCSEETHRVSDGRWAWALYADEQEPSYSHQVDEDELASWCEDPALARAGMR